MMILVRATGWQHICLAAAALPGGSMSPTGSNPHGTRHIELWHTMASVSSNPPETEILAYQPHKVSGIFVKCTETELSIPWRKCKIEEMVKHRCYFT